MPGIAMRKHTVPGTWPLAHSTARGIDIIAQRAGQLAHHVSLHVRGAGGQQTLALVHLQAGVHVAGPVAQDNDLHRVSKVDTW